MKQLFINPDTGLFRAGWRILAFTAIFLALNGGLMFGVRSVLGSLPATGTMWFLLLGIAATVAVYITTNYISKRSLTALGLRFNSLAVKDLLAGIFISALIMTLMYVLLLGLGYIKFEGFSWWKDKEHTLGVIRAASLVSMSAVVFQFAVVAWWEELTFRGILLQNISAGLNVKWGIILSTIGFGLVHAGNPNATVLSTLLIMIITFKLVYAYLKSGQLWLPIGLHWGWNFFQASIFGFASSGHLSPSLIAQTPIGPDWLSGGTFGAENSVFIVPLTIGSLYLMHLWVKYSRGLQQHTPTDLLVSEDDFKPTAKKQSVRSVETVV